MSNTVMVTVDQTGPSVSAGVARTHELVIDRPVAKGGTDQGPMGGELFLLSVGGCFMSNLLAAIRAREAPVSRVRIVVEGTLAGTPQCFTEVRLTVKAAYEDAELMRKLMTIADRGCIMTNTLRGALALPIDLSEDPV